MISLKRIEDSRILALDFHLDVGHHEIMQVVDSTIQDFLEETLGTEEVKIYSLAGDASSRRYFRVVKGQNSWVLMKWEPYDPKDYPFISVLNHFKKNNVQVPEVVKQSPTWGLVLLEDLGDLTLERKFWENQYQASSLDFYKMAIDELIKIHGEATEDRSDCAAFKIQFDTEKFLWELNYGKDNLLTGILNFHLSEKAGAELDKVFLDICQKLHQEPKRIAHRDYHARNLMIKLDQMRVIDFQDARLGPIQYDLVSLLKDSYVNLSSETSEALLDYYLERAKPFLPSHFSRHQFDCVYELQTIQRCFKACGSFASFYHQRGDRRYLKYLNETLTRVLKSLTLFPEYRVFVDVLIDSGALIQKYDLL